MSVPLPRWCQCVRSLALGAALISSTVQATTPQTSKAAAQAIRPGGPAASANAAGATPTTLANLHVFSVPTGETPAPTLAIDAAGNLYGVAQFGGADNAGTVFQAAPDGTVRVLHSFGLDGLGASVDGYDPEAAPLVAADGFLYGTTTMGGTNGAGTIYRLDPVSGMLATLASFDAGTTGSSCVAPLVTDGNGNFYGVAQTGGANGGGTLFVLNAASGTLTTLASFDATTGTGPQSALLLARNGNLYGTAPEGGSSQHGTVFQYSLKAGVLTVLENFDGATMGASPNGPLVSDGRGNFFGTAQSGGSKGGGTVFELAINAAPIPSATSFTTLFNFVLAPVVLDSTVTNAPSAPGTGVMFGTDGNLYGTSYGGDFYSYMLSRSGPAYVVYYGTLFQLVLNTPDTNGNPATLNTAFTDSGVRVVGATPVVDAAGHIFTVDNGASEYFSGSISELTPVAGSSPRTYTASTFYNFGLPEGREPRTALTLGSDGNLYGTTTKGAIYTYGDGEDGNGTLFVYSPRTGVTTTLYRFVNSDTVQDGTDPSGKLAEGAPGVFYGTTETGGVNGGGTLFRLNTATDPVSGAISGTVTTMYSFAFSYSSVAPDGTNPSGVLARAADGTFYGTTYSGGDSSDGIIFHFDPATGAVTTAASFAGAVPLTPSSPQVYPGEKAGLTLAADGTFYGVTDGNTDDVYGSIYQFDPAAGTITTRFNFTGGYGVFPDGASPFTPLLRGTNGLLYGTTQYGGPTAAYGTLFQFDPATSKLTTLVNFDGNNGMTPTGQIVQAADGNLYGTTEFGGPNYANETGGGALYQYNPNTGAFATLVTFGKAAGQNPVGGLSLGADGNLFGTTPGGTNYYGDYTDYPAPTSGAAVTNTAVVGNANGDAYGTVFEVMAAPTVTSGSVAQGTVGQEFSFQVTGTFGPTTFAAGGLPAGLTINAAAGVISGTPTAAGTFPVTITAGNSAGTATQTLTIVIAPRPTPVPVLPTVTVVLAGDGEAVEGGENGKAFFYRTGSTATALTVRYQVNGSARAGVDYQAVTDAVTIPAGAVRAKVKIRPLDDNVPEGKRVAKVKLLPASDGSYLLGSAIKVKIEIIDND